MANLRETACNGDAIANSRQHGIVALTRYCNCDVMADLRETACDGDAMANSRQCGIMALMYCIGNMSLQCVESSPYVPCGTWRALWLFLLTPSTFDPVSCKIEIVIVIICY